MRKEPALFLDRDGVINKNYGYVYRIEEFDLFPEVVEICKLAKDANLPIVVITNQSGIGRGYYSEADFELLSDWMIRELKCFGIEISLVLHASEIPSDADQESSTVRRKPSPQMFFEAADKLRIDLSESIMIGDSENDMIAAQRAGVSNRVLIAEEPKETAATVVVSDHLACKIAVGEILTTFNLSRFQ